ncbi:hypothetical protein [Brevibacillus antibioticus]|uniref:hypothetical protein n=1 Tax=Brevibacillus antibioticus TaxID=2570228 RepID=UPI001FCB0CA1|nr:hypothetical protein [Brevibacillus antibioticus]
MPLASHPNDAITNRLRISSASRLLNGYQVKPCTFSTTAIPKQPDYFPLLHLQGKIPDNAAVPA